MLQHLRHVVAPSVRRFRRLSSYLASSLRRKQEVAAEAVPSIKDREIELFGWASPNGEFVPGFPIDAHDVVVDVGCGGGWASVYSANRGATIVAIDILQQAVDQTIRQIRQFNPQVDATGLVSACDPIPLPDAMASRVVCQQVIEHVEDPARFLGELVRIGKPGAQYLLSVPDPAAEHAQRICAPQSYWSRPNHLRIIEREEFADMIRAAGLVVEQRQFFGCYWAMWWLLRWTYTGDCPFGDGANKVLYHWNETWRALLDSPNGQKIREGLESVLPKDQIVLARKPLG